MMNLTKFSSPHLDTPRSRYEFLKFVTKSMKKINKENQISNRALWLGAPGVYTLLRLMTGSHGQLGPMRQRDRAKHRLDRRKARQQRGHRR